MSGEAEKAPKHYRVRQFFGDAKHDFQLNIGELEELEAELDQGFGVLKARFTPSAALPFGGYTLAATKMVLRLGLIGAGMEKERAARLADRHVVPGELGACALLAYVVLAAAETGSPEIKPGEEDGEAAPTSPLSPTAASDGPSSTRPAAPSDGPQTSSPASRSGRSSRPSKASRPRTG